MATTRREMLVQIAAAPLVAAQQHPGHAPAKPVTAGARKPRTFTQHEYDTLRVLSDLILPPDEKSGGGAAAGTAEFLDVMAVGDAELRARFTGGVAWLDHEMRERHGKTFRECTPAEQKAMLDRLAWREKAPAELRAGAAFFALMRQWTVDAFYSSPQGVKDLGYVGNTAVAEFSGCPDDVVKTLLERSPV